MPPRVVIPARNEKAMTHTARALLGNSFRRTILSICHSSTPELLHRFGDQRSTPCSVSQLEGAGVFLQCFQPSQTAIPIDGGMLLLEQFAFRFSERLVNEMTSNTIEQDCLVEIASDDAKKRLTNRVVNDGGCNDQIYR